MSHYKRKTIDKREHQAVVTLLLCIIISLLVGYLDVIHTSVKLQAKEDFISPASTQEVQEATVSAEVRTEIPTPSPTITALAPKTAQCTQNYPGITSKIKHHYGDHWIFASNLICHESSFNQHAINPSSGACGLAQALPCEKMGCSLDDTDCQLSWQKQYIENRYGTAEDAWNFWLKNNWY